jgi:hypothetical protein
MPQTKTFSQFRNCHNGQDIVLIATGPNLSRLRYTRQCSAVGYSKIECKPANILNNSIPKIKAGWDTFKEFACKNFPKTEIISINPIGLAGLFNDFDSYSGQSILPSLYADSNSLVGAIPVQEYPVQH